MAGNDAGTSELPASGGSSAGNRQTEAEKRQADLIRKRSKALASDSGSESWWQYLEPVIEGGSCKLRCTLCKELLTSSNPSQSASNHFGKGKSKGGCKHATTAKRGAADSGDASEANKKPKSSAPLPGQASMRTYMPNNDAKAKAVREMSLFFFR
jgi:hypothetical protein